ncbi:hypothetical protein CUJ84_Chr003649 [Rhizobium leguminosarum]|uniref:Uncharacterized protein n=1 Tax=Rhizobium leguminosarum TaxID=384 RepID=A0A2K9Z719_RHILE|nr:hypothetical protein CUJ84_Chr003649 [Rhizobium leguminosarum]
MSNLTEIIPTYCAGIPTGGPVTHPGGSSTLLLGWLHKCGHRYRCISLNRSQFRMTILGY